MERVSSFKFLGVHISENLTWTVNTTALVKKAQLRLYFPRTLKKTNLSAELLKAFYLFSTESVLTYCITSCYANCTQADRTNLQTIIHTSQKIIGLPCPHWMTSSGHAAFTEPAASCLMQPSPATSSSRYCHLEGGTGLKARTTRLKNSFVPRAIIKLNLNNHCPVASTTSA